MSRRKYPTLRNSESSDCDFWSEDIIDVRLEVVSVSENYYGKQIISVKDVESGIITTLLVVAENSKN